MCAKNLCAAVPIFLICRRDTRDAPDESGDEGGLRLCDGRMTHDKRQVTHVIIYT